MEPNPYESPRATDDTYRRLLAWKRVWFFTNRVCWLLYLGLVSMASATITCELYREADQVTLALLVGLWLCGAWGLAVFSEP